MNRARRRVEMKQLREVWRSCTRDNVEADESYVVLNSAADCMFDRQVRLAVSDLQVMPNRRSATYRRGGAKMSLPG